MLHQLSREFMVGMPRRGPLCVVISLLFGLLSSGCSKRQLTVKVNIANGANGNNPVALDLVSVNDKDLLKEISKLTAADWFQKRDQYLLDYSKPGVLAVRSGEWVPGQAVPSMALPAPLLPIPVPMLSSKATVLAFANYFSPGPHRAKLQPEKVTTIQLGEDDLKIVIDKK
jgi:type VI secretion system protein